MNQRCVECDRVWQEYEDALISHIKLVTEMQRAIEQEDSVTFTRLEPLVTAALARRKSAQQAVKDHEAMHSVEPAKETGK
jgi:hypothetical protein